MRGFLAKLTAIVACVVLPLGLVSAWLDLQVTDTDRYVDKVGQIAEHEDVERATERWLTDFTVRTIDQLTLLPVAELGRGIIEAAVEQVVASPDFERIWRTSNRTVHPQIIGVLEGSTRGISTGNGTIGLELGPLVDAVIGEASGGGVPGLDLGPVDASIPLIRSSDLADAQDAYAIAEAAGLWLLAVWVGLVLLALWLAPSRRSVLGILSYGSIATLLLLVGSMFWVRDQLVESALTPADGALVGAVWDVLAGDLYKAIGGLLAVSVVVVVGRLFVRR